MKCQKCGTDIFLPFQCQYCGEYFCSEHRLPENHDCSQISRARAPREETQPISIERQKSHEFTVSFPHLGKRRARFRFSAKEIKHLSIGILLVAGVGLSLIGFQSLIHRDYGSLALYIVMFTTSFFIHEMAHKALAQSYGLWAEFRLTLIGALLTMFSMIPTFIKIIAPGAVMVAGPYDNKVMGKTSAAGPATNITLAAALLALTFAVPNCALMFAQVAFFNGWIAVFNLIPFGMLDGLKIFGWDKKIWTILFATSLTITILSYRYF